MCSDDDFYEHYLIKKKKLFVSKKFNSAMFFGPSYFGKVASSREK